MSPPASAPSHSAAGRAGVIGRVSGAALLALAATALLTVVIGLSRLPEPAGSDEGALARIFQLSIVASLPAGLVFVAATDWRRSRGAFVVLAASGVLVVLALSLLSYGEHLR